MRTARVSNALKGMCSALIEAEHKTIIEKSKFYQRKFKIWLVLTDF